MHSLAWVAALAPLLGALGMARARDGNMARWMAAGALAISLAASLAIMAGSAVKGIGPAPMALFALLALVTAAAMPRQDAQPRALAWLLLLAAGTQTVYGSENQLLLLAGYALTVAPFLDREKPFSSLVLAAGCVALGAALAFGSFWPLVVAIMLRKTIFPWRGSMMAALLFNGHLGAFLLVKLMKHDAVAGQWLPVVGVAALVAAVIAAVAALADGHPRRALALVAASQAGCILAGLASATPEAVQGALMQWMVVGLASTGLFTVYRLIEVRYGGEITGREFLGLAERFPRLAVFFAVCALAMVGLPGTLGFLSEDLLIHGLMETQSYIGILQPLAAALNAITLLRLFSTLFLGRRVRGMEAVPDAIPRERWALSALVALLVLGGLAPGFVTALNAPATDLTARVESHRR